LWLSRLLQLLRTIQLLRTLQLLPAALFWLWLLPRLLAAALIAATTQGGVIISGWPPRGRWSPAPPSSAGDKPRHGPWRVGRVGAAYAVRALRDVCPGIVSGRLEFAL